MHTWNMKQIDAIQSLSALAHDGRLTLMRLLIQAGPEGMGSGALARRADIALTTASAQLLVLTNAGLVRSRRDGRHVTYFAEYGRFEQLMSFLMHDCCAGRCDFTALANRAELA